MRRREVSLFKVGRKRRKTRKEKRQRDEKREKEKEILERKKNSTEDQ